MFDYFTVVIIVILTNLGLPGHALPELNCNLFGLHRHHSYQGLAFAKECEAGLLPNELDLLLQSPWLLPDASAIQ